MSSQATNPAEGARKLTTHPYVGIAGVLLGAMIATCTGRLMSVGLADIRGALHLGVDEASWINTSFNASMMFIGPFSVYLGGLLGPRRVLLSCAWIFTAVTFLIPFCHSLPPVIALLIIGGLTAGTFYPLTLSFVLRNLPMRFVLAGHRNVRHRHCLYDRYGSGVGVVLHGAPLVALDLLERDHTHSIDDSADSLRHPLATASQTTAGPSGPELERIPVCKPWSCSSVYSSRSGTAARLVPLLAHCWIDCCRSTSCRSRGCPPLSPAQSSRQLSIPHAEEHAAAGTCR